MNLPDVVFMMGPSGVGKGTQSQIFADRHGYFHWDQGAIFRSMGGFRLKSGALLSEHIAAGNFVSDAEVMEVFGEKIKEVPPGRRMIFDGLPRSVGQAKALVEHFRAAGKKMTTLYLDAHEDELIKRLLARAETQGRADDNLESIERRFAQFRELVLPAIEYLKGETDFHDIDSRPPIPEVTAAIEKALGHVHA